MSRKLKVHLLHEKCAQTLSVAHEFEVKDETYVQIRKYSIRRGVISSVHTFGEHPFTILLIHYLKLLC